MQYNGPHIDWTQYKVQPWYFLDATSGIKWPMGVFRAAAPTQRYDSLPVAGEIQLFDKMLELDQDGPIASFTVANTLAVTDAIEQILTELGKTKFVIETSSKKLTNNMTWTAGTPWLKIINELLDAINYFSVWVDPYGFFRISAYVDPAARGVAWVFKDNESSILIPEFDREEDYFSVPNRFIGVATSSGELPPLTSFAENNDPNSRTSFAHRGEWITVTEEGIEAADQATLDAITERRLRELSDITQTLDIQVAAVPMDLNSVVEFESIISGLESRLCVVQKFSYSTGLGDPMSVALRELTQ
jgi:hypothetical protein